MDSSTFLRTTSQDIINGMNRDGLGTLADRVCTVENKASTHGTLRRRDSKDSLPRDVGGQAIGANPRLRSHGFDSDNYDMLQYDDGFTVTEQEIIEMADFRMDLKQLLETSRQNVNIAIDADLQALLGAETNTKAAGAGAWSATTSTPVSDIQDGIKANIPAAMAKGSQYCGVIGLQTAIELSRHPDLLATTAFYDSGMSLPLDSEFAALKIKLASITGIPAANWYVGDQFYDSNDEGLAVSLSFLFGDFLWIGAKRALKRLEQPRRGAGDQASDQFGAVTIERYHNQYEVVYMRTLDIVRQDNQLALRWTSI